MLEFYWFLCIVAPPYIITGLCCAILNHHINVLKQRPSIYLNKWPVHCPSDHRWAELWPMGVKKDGLVQGVKFGLRPISQAQTSLCPSQAGQARLLTLLQFRLNPTPAHPNSASSRYGVLDLILIGSNFYVDSFYITVLGCI